MIVTHAPFVAAFEALTDRGKKIDDGWVIPFGRVVRNLPEVLAATEAGNVRAFISGHLHTVEEIERDGVRYINSGSVSGQQWNGPRLGFPEGFGVFESGRTGPSISNTATSGGRRRKIPNEVTNYTGARA